MDLYLVKNEAAGTTDHRNLDQACLKAGAQSVQEVSLDELDKIPPGSRIVAAGGDGTVSCVAGYAVEHNCQLAVLALGTGNDFARSQELYISTLEALDLAVKSNTIKKIDLGYVEDLPFLNHVSVGISTEANEIASQETTKKALGSPAYAVGAVVAAVKAEPIEVEVIVDGKTVWNGPLWQVSVANTGRFGGGASLDSSSNDGRLEVYIFEPTKRLDFFKRAWGLLFSEIKDQAGVQTFKGKKVVVRGSGKLAANVDGDIKEFNKEFTVQIKPGALQLVSKE